MENLKFDKDCLFCNFVSGNFKTPGIFWEDEEFMAFLTIFPNTEGATVVIPKNHYPSDVLALPDEYLQKFVVAAKKVSNILLKTFDDVGRVGLVMEGTGINHAHIKLYPMHGTEYLKNGKWQNVQSGNKSKFFETYEGYLTSSDSDIVSDDIISELAEKLKK